jgi:RimJ/RimL family protein N-acetyltransferase
MPPSSGRPEGQLRHLLVIVSYLGPERHVIHIRPGVPGDAEQLLVLRRTLFSETSLLLWEPAEFKSTAEQEAQFIERIASRTNRLLLIAFASGTAVGFLAAIGGERNRLKHSVLLALGVLREQWSQGIASPMLGHVIAWAPGAGVKRLELTVDTSNERAFLLYRRLGFEVEGTRRCSLLVDGEFKNEYLMSHIAGI